MDKRLAMIFARGGSKGIPRKALAPLGPMPVIAYTIRDGLAIDSVTKVCVNTDDPEIRAVGLAHGAEAPFLRPAALARDGSSATDAYAWALAWYRDNQGFVPDIVIAMFPTYPFRRPGLIDAALRRALDDSSVGSVGSAVEAGAGHGNRWELDGEAWRPFRGGGAGPAQDGPAYCAAMSFNIVVLSRQSPPGRRIPFPLNEIESIDLDEPEDLELARAVVDQGYYPFHAARH
jgi:N-acylneuraminate cytidylyltransferase